MSGKNRLWQSIKEKVTYVGLALLVTYGFPLIYEYAGSDLESMPILAQAKQIGYYVLWSSPAILTLLLFQQIWSLKRRQKKINQKINEEGVTYLILPRPDGKPVIGAEVTLWHRIALALPYYEHFSFEMSGGENGITYSLRATNENAARNILSKVMAEWPGTQMRRPDIDPLSVATDAYWIEIKPLRNDQPIIASTASPITALLSEIGVLPKGIQAGIQVQVREDPFTRMKLGRRADKKTSKKQNVAEPLSYNPSAEEGRQVQKLDERAQEAFLETRIIIWAQAEDDKIARETAIKLAEGVSAQYHPNNKLIKAWRCKKGNMMERSCPTFGGHPWIASELGTIAHLVGQDALLATPQLKVAPARPLPAPTPCRLSSKSNAPIYLLLSQNPKKVIISKDEELPTLTYENFETLPTLTYENLETLPTLTYENFETLPTLTYENSETNPMLLREKRIAK